METSIDQHVQTIEASLQAITTLMAQVTADVAKKEAFVVSTTQALTAVKA